MTAAEKIQLASTIVVGLGVLVAIGAAWINITHERRRSQPIVIAHEDRSRYSVTRNLGAAAHAVDAHTASEGGGPAFNVRFGVEYAGVRFPYKLRVEDPASGNVQRVVPSGSRMPEAGSWPILIDLERLFGLASSGEREMDVGRIYWARYENAQGKVWETRNPGDRSARLDIARVHFVRWREWREGKARDKASKHGQQWEREALAELKAIRDEAEKAERETADESDG